MVPNAEKDCCPPVQLLWKAVCQQAPRHLEAKRLGVRCEVMRADKQREPHSKQLSPPFLFPATKYKYKHIVHIKDRWSPWLWLKGRSPRQTFQRVAVPLERQP